MNIVFLTGSHKRHAYFARKVAETGKLAGLVVEDRREAIPEPPKGIPHATRELFVKHFEERDDAELRFFGNGDLPSDIPTIHTTQNEINNNEVLDFIAYHQPDLLLSYGVHKLSSGLLDSLPGEAWNVHGGLSPWYRGAITHFWPQYLLEPQMTGMTVHDLTDEIDGGGIIHQNAAPMVRGDGVHDGACRAVQGCAEELPKLFNFLEDPYRMLPRKYSKTTGRIWRGSDWRPEHLHVIYNQFHNRIIDAYLDGFLNTTPPILHRQF